MSQRFRRIKTKKESSTGFQIQRTKTKINNISHHISIIYEQQMWRDKQRQRSRDEERGEMPAGYRRRLDCLQCEIISFNKRLSSPTGEEDTWTQLTSAALWNLRVHCSHSPYFTSIKKANTIFLLARALEILILFVNSFLNPSLLDSLNPRLRGTQHMRQEFKEWNIKDYNKILTIKKQVFGTQSTKKGDGSQKDRPTNQPASCWTEDQWRRNWKWNKNWFDLILNKYDLLM